MNTAPRLGRWGPLVALATTACATATPPPSPTSSAPVPVLPERVAAPSPPNPAAPAEPTPTTPPLDPSVRFLAVGDVMLSRGVADAIEAHGDHEWPFRPLADLFAAVDFTFANLEAPFARRTVTPLYGNVFNAPRAYVAGLVSHRFRVLNLANNHAMDQGFPGLVDTATWVREHGLLAFGAGTSKGEAWTPALLEVRGIRIGFVGASYCSVNDEGQTWLPYVARIQDRRELRGAIASLRDEADFVVATMHAGVEYRDRAFAPQRRFVQDAIEAGADLVVGAHPHVVQPAEQIDGVWVFYSLGNFIFDRSERPHTDEGAALEITLTRHDEEVALTGLTVTPIVIRDGAPTPLTGDREAEVLRRMHLQAPTLVPSAEAP